MNRLAFLVTRIASAALDQLTRAAVLEGVARVPVGSWKNHANGLARAQAHFDANGPEIEPVWFVRQDMGLYKAIYFGALSVTQDRQDAEEVAQNVLAGFTRSEDVEGGQLYDVGKKLMAMGADDVTIKRAIGMLKLHGKHRAMKRGPRFESMTVEDEDGGTSVRDVSAPVDQDDVLRRILEFLADPSGGNVYKVIRRELAREWASAPKKLEIFDAIVESPDASDTEVARATGTLWQTPWQPHHLAPNQAGFVDADGTLNPWPKFTKNDKGEVWFDEKNKPRPKATESATLVTRTRSEIKKLLPEIVAQKPGILRNVDLQMELSNLGYGGQARWARCAKNLILVLTTP